MNWCIARITDFSEAEYDAAYAALSPSRKEHIDAFRHPGARQQSLAGELLLHRLLQTTGCEDIIVRLPSGQPALEHQKAFVSIAHCDEYVVCAVSDNPIGIDIEKVRPVKPGMAAKICTPEELRFVQQDEARFFEVWTAKEAWFKMVGTGITDFRMVDILTLPRQVFRQDDYLIQLVYEE